MDTQSETSGRKVRRQSDIMKLNHLVSACVAVILIVAAPFTAAESPDLGALFVQGVNDTTQVGRMDRAKQVYSADFLSKITPEKAISLFDRLHGQYGHLEYHHSEITGDYLHLYARSSADNRWHDFQFKIAKTPAVRLEGIVFIADVAEPIYLPNGSIDNQHTLDWLKSYVEKLSKENDLAAAVLIAKGDSVIFERYLGYADAARTRPISPHTRMNLGSGNKMFTALAIMQLRDAGNLQLTDSLSRYFPDYPHKEYINSATVGQLLSHTSGSGDYWTDAYEAAWDSIQTLDQMIPFVLVDTPTFAPGTQFQYSNSGFILVGKIIEKVSGEDYFDFVRKHIYRPLMMESSDSYLKLANDTTLAEPLARSGDGWKIARHGLRGSSAGGGYSTPRDMLRFMRGLTRNTIVAPVTLQEMVTPRNLELEPAYPYGYGFALALRSGRVISYGHAGQAPGINFEARYYPDDDITMVVFCNQDNGAYDDLRRNIDKLITGDR